MDTDVKTPGGLDLGFNNGGHCYPSHMDNSLQAMLTKTIHGLHKIDVFSLRKSSAYRHSSSRRDRVLNRLQLSYSQWTIMGAGGRGSILGVKFGF